MEAVAKEVTQLPGYDLAVKLLEPPEPPETQSGKNDEQ